MAIAQPHISTPKNPLRNTFAILSERGLLRICATLPDRTVAGRSIRMSEKIEPVLSAAEWRQVREYEASNSAVNRGEMYDEIIGSNAGMIAAYNDLLPDDDPRKITREWVRELRKTADSFDESERLGEKEGACVETSLFRQIADALESYLRPEGT